MTDAPGPQPAPSSASVKGGGALARRFSRLTHAVSASVRRLLPATGPWGVLHRGVEPTFVGFCLLSLSGFVVDLAGLWLFKGVLHIAFPVAVSLGYALASLYNFAMNRVLNFRAHGHLAGQGTRWVVVAASTYLLWILGLAWLLEHLGVNYLVARLSVTVVEVVWVYTLSRVWVFRDVPIDA